VTQLVPAGKKFGRKYESRFDEAHEIRTIGLILAFCFLGGALCFAADPQMGTWKLNEAKSKITPGTAKFTTVSFKSMLGQVKTRTGSTRTANPSTSSGRANLMGKIIRLPATQAATPERIEKWMIAHWN